MTQNMPEKSLWARKVEQQPDHSHWFVQRFRDLLAAGKDIAGESRLVDALVPRGARILDAGCGSGRTGGPLAERGHTVVGVDVDPVLIEAARADYPAARWYVQDLAALDLGALGEAADFDAVVAAGNVMPFLAPSTRREVLGRLRAALAPDGRMAVGFGAGRGYPFDEFADDAAATGWRIDSRFRGWNLLPFEADSEFLVAIMTPVPVPRRSGERRLPSTGDPMGGHILRPME